MDDPSHNEVLHLKVDEHLPALPTSVPAAEVLKQILEQMLENERRRVRNEFIRISILFLILLLMIMGGGFWIARDILIQVQEARQMSERSQDALITFMAAVNRQGPDTPSLLPPPMAREKQSPPAHRAAAPAEHPTDIQQTIAGLEEKNQSLSELMQTQNTDLKNLVMDVLKSRATQLQDLRSKINAKQTQVIAAQPVDVEAVPRPPASQSSPKSTIPDRPLATSLTAPVTADLPLRLPIPRP